MSNPWVDFKLFEPPFDYLIEIELKQGALYKGRVLYIDQSDHIRFEHLSRLRSTIPSNIIIRWRTYLTDNIKGLEN